MKRAGLVSLLLSAALALGPAQAVAVALVGGDAGSGRHGRDKGEWPACSCDCCNVAERRPDEVVEAVRVKCSPAHDHSADVCAEQCTLDENDPLLGSMAQDHGLDYQQFCFYECKPADGAMSFVGAQCINFEEAEVARIVDPAGNAVDPAFLYASQPQVPFERSSNLLARSRGGCGGVVQSAALLSRSHMVQSANPSASAAVESDSEAAEIVKATVDEVVKGRLRAQTQRRETKSAKENTLKMQEKFAAADPLAAVREIQNAVARSGEAKDSAMKYARTAVNVMQNSHGKMWHDALSAADIEMGRFREESRKAAEAAAYSPKLWREYAAEAAARASKPYLDAVQQSQQIAQQWHIAAGEAVQEAQADQGQANALKIEAEELQQAGQKDQAQAKMDEAKDLDAKSTALFGRARQMVVTAQEAVASANGNYAVAQEAAKRAGAEVKFPPMAA